MVRRNAPRWASWGSALTMIRAPFASFCARTPNARAASASSAPATSANDRGTSGASATSDRSMRFSGMRSSSSGSTGSVAAAAATASSFSAEMSTGVPSANVAGEHAMSADGRAASGSPKSTTCAMRSFATSLTSSNPSVATACNVAACAVSGSMNVWSHATYVRVGRATAARPRPLVVLSGRSARRPRRRRVPRLRGIIHGAAAAESTRASS